MNTLLQDIRFGLRMLLKSPSISIVATIALALGFGANTVGNRIVEELIKDIRYAFRSLARRPAFTAVAVITLALGIGANTAIFSVVYGVLLRPLAYPEPGRLVALRESNALKQPDAQVAPGNFLEWGAWVFGLGSLVLGLWTWSGQYRRR